MLKCILLVLIFIVNIAPASAQERPEIKPGLVTTYTAFTERPASSSVIRLGQSVGFTLQAAQTLDPRLSQVQRVEWNGILQIVTPGTYTFTAMQAGGTLTVSLTKDKDFFDVSKNPTKLDPGIYQFKATFELDNKPDVKRVELYWEGPGFTREPIPYYFLGHFAKNRPARLATDIDREHGRYLYEEFSCAKCHQAPKEGKVAPGLAEHTGPNLTQISSRVYPGWLDTWLADPSKLRPHTTMPKIFPDDVSGRAERYAVVKYLTSLGKPLSDDLKLPNMKEDMASTERGKVLFVTTGCAACHANKPNAPTRKRTDDDDPLPAFSALDSVYGLGSSTGVQGTYALGAVGSKTRPETLAVYLLDPLKTNPHGRMPGMGLNAKDALDIARYLCRTQDDKIDRRNPQGTTLQPEDIAEKVLGKKPRAEFAEQSADKKWVELGRTLIVNKGCVNCHIVEENGKTLELSKAFPNTMVVKGVPQTDLTKPGIVKGCLAEKPEASNAPQYKLTPEQRTALIQFVQIDLNVAGPNVNGLNNTATPSPLTNTRASFKRFMCLNCHQRDGEGGLSAELVDQMKLLEKVETGDNLQPPRLTGIGHKALTPWLHKVLLEGERARPWMSLRMPQYGPANLGDLPAQLAYLEGTLPETANAPIKQDTPLIAAGKTLTGKDGYGCIACHDISGISGGGTRGPDLALAPGRVRREWFERWMNNPQRVTPGTQMPTYFLDGKAQNNTLGGDPTKQTHALWAYANLGPGLPLPTGMEPPKGVVIAVRDKAEILRTFMPYGAGTRALAVGYPGGFNLAYDAQQARLSYTWAGHFLDASPVWTNRGGAPAKLLGPKTWDSPAGHPWVVINEREESPDFVKQSANPAYGAPVGPDQVYLDKPALVFDGYSLDIQGKPTFQYHHQSGSQTMLTVEETPSPLTCAVASGMERKFEVTVATGLTAFLRIAETEGQPQLLGSKIATELRVKEGRVILAQPGGRVVVLEASGPEGTVWLPRKRDNGPWETNLRFPTGKGTVTVCMWFLPKDDPELLKALPKVK